jgi:hypothetical protein
MSETDKNNSETSEVSEELKDIEQDLKEEKGNKASETEELKKAESELGEIDKDIKQLTETENHVKSETNTKNNWTWTGAAGGFVRLILFILILLTFFLILIRFDILNSVSLISNLISALFNFYTGNTVWAVFSAKEYIGYLTMYILAIIYLNILLIPIMWFEYFLRAKDDIKEKTQKVFYWEFMILIILLMPIGTSTLWANTFELDDQDPIETVSAQSSSWWENLWNGPLCYIDSSKTTSECNKKENSAEIESKTIEKYTIRLETPSNPYFTLPYLIEEKIPVTYSFETGKKGIYVEKLECYQGSTLIDTVEINQDIIALSKKNVIFKCSAEKLKLKSQLDESVEIKTTLYTTIETDYDLEIPVVNYELYLEKINSEEGERVFEEAKKDLGIGRIAPSNNALKFTIENSQFPIVINSPENILDYSVSITFEEDSLNNLGNLKKSTVTSFTQPENKIIEVSNLPTIPHEIATFKDKSTLRFSVSSLNSIELESLNDVIQFTTESEFEKKGTLRLAIEDPNFTQEKEETPIASNENTKPQTTQETPNTPEEQTAQNEQEETPSEVPTETEIT